MDASLAVDRRRFLVVLAAGLAGVAVGHGVDQLSTTVARATARAAAPAPKPPAAPAGIVPVDPPLGVVTDLPGTAPAIALTIDDGTSHEVVAAYAKLAVDTGIRLTFFPNGCYTSWADNAAVLRPLVDSGQVALGNHTWSHPDITSLSEPELVTEIGRNKDFIRNTFGVDTPFFRPPFGYHDDRTDAIAADQGHPTIAMWDGTLGDDKIITGPDIVEYARQWFVAQQIVIGHANHPAVTGVYGELLDLIGERKLTTVTLADVWATRS